MGGIVGRVNEVAKVVVVRRSFHEYRCTHSTVQVYR